MAELNPQLAVKVQALVQILVTATASAKAQILNMQNLGSSISIGDMFNMQITMNRLSQLSEMTTNVVSALNTMLMSMARNVKG